jgi:phage terminase large subunit-like protein
VTVSIRALQEERLMLLEEKQRRISRRLFHYMHPEENVIWRGADNKDFPNGATIYNRHLYPRHMEFFRVGAQYRERAAICANRVGKTISIGGYELTAHLTGLYPDWWEGRVFPNSTRCWAAGKTNETTRDILQATLLGEVAHEGQRKIVTGTGLIPGDLIGEITWRQGVADLVDTVKVKHRNRGWSVLGFKAYAQGRGSFEGTAQHCVLLDEEPPLDIYGECLVRTATTGGIIMLTFTPLEGRSETVNQFMTKGKG